MVFVIGASKRRTGMRLGDLDRIAQDVRDNNIENYYKQDWTSSQIVTLLENAPTINAVPVVRCRECRYWSEDGRCDPPQNGLIREYTRPDDFCSYGEEADHEVSE